MNVLDDAFTNIWCDALHHPLNLIFHLLFVVCSRTLLRSRIYTKKSQGVRFHDVGGHSSLQSQEIIFQKKFFIHKSEHFTVCVTCRTTCIVFKPKVVSFKTRKNLALYSAGAPSSFTKNYAGSLLQCRIHTTQSCVEDFSHSSIFVILNSAVPFINVFTDIWENDFFLRNSCSLLGKSRSTPANQCFLPWFLGFNYYVTWICFQERFHRTLPFF